MLANAYNDLFYNEKVEYRSINGGRLVFYKRSLDDFDISEILKVESKVLEISLLLGHLEKEGFIYLIEDWSSNEPLQEIGGFIKENLIPIEKQLDSNINNILSRSLNHRIFVNQSLKDLVKSDFKTVEDIALENSYKQIGCAQQQTEIAQKQTRLAFFALILSIISMTISIFRAFC